MRSLTAAKLAAALVRPAWPSAHAWKAALFIAVAGLGFTGSEWVGAAEGVKQVMGTVHGKSAQQLQIRTTEGGIVSVNLGPQTRYERQGKAARPEDLKSGARVVVEAEEMEGRLRARLVRIGVTAPSTGHGAHQPPATSTPATEGGRRPEAHAGHEQASPRGHASTKGDSVRSGPTHPSGHMEHAGPSARAHTSKTMSPPMDMAEHAGMALHPLGFGRGRFGSGTSWLPDTTPTHHLMRQSGPWTLMAHGAVFGGYVAMNGPRGGEKAFAPNMVMLMAERRTDARTLLRFSGMFSADAATVGGEGYPLLLQTGETWRGQPLRDRQHPHNVLSELSAAVSRAVGPSKALAIYLAPVGEPALGPPAFPHRPLGLNDPLAPIGHHWQDATHIAYGVVTAGVQTRRWQIEGSTFNGREPGEDRAEIRSPKFDSASGRLSFNPAPSTALQVSHGYLHRPEEAHPEHDSWRTTASAVWVRSLGPDRTVDATILWGRNRTDRQDLDSWLLEGEWSNERGLTPFARFEYVEKNAEELVLPTGFAPDRIFALRQATIGGVYTLPLKGTLSWGLGMQAIVSLVPHDLESVYGSNPGGWSAFIRARPRSANEGMMH